jgi:hypothetical protein
MTPNYISYESCIDLLSWEGSVAALRAGTFGQRQI